MDHRLTTLVRGAFSSLSTSSIDRPAEASEACNACNACNVCNVRRSPGASRSARADRPRERLIRNGAGSLADAELVALILRTGDHRHDAWALARGILERFGGLAGLAVTPSASLEAMPGLGPAKSASLRASIEMARRLVDEPLELGQPIRSPKDIQRHFRTRLRGLRRESFHVLLLDGRHRLISTDEVSVGTLTASLVHPREVFREAIRAAAAALVLVHNHPSGDPTPSAEDRSVTDRLRAAGRLLGIRVLDHVIVTAASYFSFREDGESFDEPKQAEPS
jgi:DNA repair protein RadC